MNENIALYKKLGKNVHSKDELLWIGTPKQLPFILSAKTFPLIIFGLMWTISLSFAGAGLFSLSGLLFIVGGVNGYLTRAVGFPETVFGLTKSRILLRTKNWFGVQLQTIEMESVLDVAITVSPVEKLFKVGTVKFFIGKMEQDDGVDYKVYHCWLAIENPHEIYELVDKAIFERKNRGKNLPKQKSITNKEQNGYKLDYEYSEKNEKRRK